MVEVKEYKAGNEVQVVEYLPCKCKTLNSNPTTTKTKNSNNKKREMKEYCSIL
jgi:hypothetical protein